MTMLLRQQALKPWVNKAAHRRFPAECCAESWGITPWVPSLPFPIKRVILRRRRHLDAIKRQVSGERMARPELATEPK